MTVLPVQLSPSAPFCFHWHKCVDSVRSCGPLGRVCGATPMHPGLGVSEKGSKLDLLKMLMVSILYGNFGLFEGSSNRALEYRHLALENEFSMFSTRVHGVRALLPSDNDLAWLLGEKEAAKTDSFVFGFVFCVLKHYKCKAVCRRSGLAR